MGISERKKKILQAVIKNYLETGEPVGSRTISKYTDLNLSSATIRNEMADLEVGAVVNADLFEAGDMVDVVGTSRGKGYMGAIYRNNQSLQPATHGTGPVHRGPGSMATIGRNNGYINKGRIMAGHEGVYRTTNQNLEIIKVDMEHNCLLIKGNVPGPRKGLVIVKTTTKPVKHVEPANLISYENKEEA